MERLEAKILELPVSASAILISCSNVDVGAGTIEKFDPRNGRTAVEIFFLSRLEPESPLGVI